MEPWATLYGILQQVSHNDQGTATTTLAALNAVLNTLQAIALAYFAKCITSMGKQAQKQSRKRKRKRKGVTSNE